MLQNVSSGVARIFQRGGGVGSREIFFSCNNMTFLAH